ncbi:hypothetical protein BESB_021770 [Besnoitia besnoiti]|uniref:Transmembrane protein n=1 Tax=Besnoitia besnoiti TaxID=94643 RepID=A0A2A9M8K0_BESBE|nr:hypothetical protein BESB_021770 [Besnoitia besnoiti]PFH32236.1 hypothetical protein BESB_021770 [Besnoitia besnoiti]
MGATRCWTRWVWVVVALASSMYLLSPESLQARLVAADKAAAARKGAASREAATAAPARGPSRVAAAKKEALAGPPFWQKLKHRVRRFAVPLGIAAFMATVLTAGWYFYFARRRGPSREPASPPPHSPTPSEQAVDFDQLIRILTEGRSGRGSSQGGSPEHWLLPLTAFSDDGGDTGPPGETHPEAGEAPESPPSPPAPPSVPGEQPGAWPSPLPGADPTLRAAAVGSADTGGPDDGERSASPGPPTPPHPSVPGGYPLGLRREASSEEVPQPRGDTSSRSSASASDSGNDEGDSNDGSHHTP